MACTSIWGIIDDRSGSDTPVSSGIVGMVMALVSAISPSMHAAVSGEVSWLTNWSSSLVWASSTVITPAATMSCAGPMSNTPVVAGSSGPP